MSKQEEQILTSIWKWPAYTDIFASFAQLGASNAPRLGLKATISPSSDPTNHFDPQLKLASNKRGNVRVELSVNVGQRRRKRLHQPFQHIPRVLHDNHCQFVALWISHAVKCSQDQETL